LDLLGQDCPADPEGSQDGEEKARPAHGNNRLHL
jgi:hypothetical protein